MTGEFRGCIDEAAAKGEIDAETAEDLRNAYDDAFAAASDVFGPSDADRKAAEAVMKKLEHDRIEARMRRQQIVRSRRQLMASAAALKQRRGYKDVQPLPGRGGSGKPPKGGWVQGGTPPEQGPGSKGAIAARFLELIVENKPGLAGGPFASIEGRYRALRGSFDAQMAALIEKFEANASANLIGKRNRAALGNVVREAFGEDTGDEAAKALAKAWAETAETARLAFNAAGGSIGKLDDWGLPQIHDPIAIREAGKDAWVAEVLPRLNRAKMIDRATGQPFTDKRLQAVLGQTYDRIVSGGAVSRPVGHYAGKSPLSATRAEERFLVFKSADDWMAYQQRFGEGDPFAAMMGHLDEMARDIAQMQILGPNPAHQWDWLKRWAEHEAQLEELKGVKGARDRAASYIQTADDMMAHFTGAAATPVNTKLASFGASSRAYLTAVSLGSAILSDIPSAPYFGALARTFSGLSRKGDVKTFVDLLASPERRAQARRAGFIIEQATDGFVRSTHDNLRLATVGAQVQGSGNAFARRLPAAVMRAQFLTPYTAARKRAFRFEFMGALADRTDKTLAELGAGDAEDRAFAELLTARGFSENDWSKIRSTPLWRPRAGAAFLRPTDVEDRELGLRLAEAIEMQTRMAAPETTLWTRAKLIGMNRPGTARGELVRSWAMFRSFSLTAWHVYAEEMALRAMRARSPVLAGTAHAAAAVTFLTLAGAVAIQIRELVKGNEPRQIDDPRFWGAALLQGGGLGLFGDFMYAAQARNGKTAGLASYGPVGQAVSDAWNLGPGNVAQVAEGLGDGATLDEAVGDARVGRDATTILRRYSPLSSLWWVRTLWSRSVVDQVQKLIDPEAEEDFARRANRLERDYGAGQWWAEGEALPAP